VEDNSEETKMDIEMPTAVEANNEKEMEILQKQPSPVKAIVEEPVTSSVVEEELKSIIDDVNEPLVELKEEVMPAGKILRRLNDSTMRSKATNNNRYKVVFLGDSRVGKTSFISRFVLNTFNSVYQATVGIDFLSKSVQVEDRVVRLQLWDTAGQEKFRSLIPSYVRDAAVVFVLYDIANLASFYNVDEWIMKVRDERGDDSIVILVGNKSDLDNERQVSYDQGKKKAEEYGVMFDEASARTGDNIKQVFRRAAASIPEEEVYSQSAASVTHIQLNVPTEADKKSGGSCLC